MQPGGCHHYNSIDLLKVLRLAGKVYTCGSSKAKNRERIDLSAVWQSSGLCYIRSDTVLQSGRCRAGLRNSWNQVRRSKRSAKHQGIRYTVPDLAG